MTKEVEQACYEFMDGVHTAVTENDFQRIAERAAHTLGFRWFAYFGRRSRAPFLISSYPKSWTDYYFDQRYQDIDPILHQSSGPCRAFRWDGREARAARSAKERRLFDDALSFNIRTGLTVPIVGGFGRVAAFTFAVDERSPGLDRRVESAKDLLQLIGLTYHAHVDAKIADVLWSDRAASLLTQRERQCLAWASRGKTMEEIAMILDVTSRAVKFHLDNARRNLGASTVTHAVALAVRHGLLP
ncbi:LuxR family transcriptional regulator [Bradyrhizobium sp. LHD-71]|uniref:helix-turn-helix transcriptional regulator n=1 Tax=Bradyrhizobium sp. LHD-71 TaxID=3072141 RepID=UPI00280DE3C0|nr:LuxR family transcriptional regulator [Bradyrhizobium sp. LHD-71]MDQ8727539.1 LuxR family transcriptional regulator [Bradyrhizobium sp. LHD-71]